MYTRDDLINIIGEIVTQWLLVHDELTHDNMFELSVISSLVIGNYETESDEVTKAS